MGCTEQQIKDFVSYHSLIKMEISEKENGHIFDECIKENTKGRLEESVLRPSAEVLTETRTAILSYESNNPFGKTYNKITFNAGEHIRNCEVCKKAYRIPIEESAFHMANTLAGERKDRKVSDIFYELRNQGDFLNILN